MMNNNWQNFPLGSFSGAIESLFGRLFYITIISAIACMIGTMMGMGEFTLIGFLFPLVALASLFAGWGLLLVPLYLVSVYLFIRCQWPAIYSLVFFVISILVGYLGGDYADSKGKLF